MSALVPAPRARRERAAAARRPAGGAGGEGKTGQAVRGAAHLRAWPSFSRDLTLRAYSPTVSARAKGLSDRRHQSAPAPSFIYKQAQNH